MRKSQIFTLFFSLFLLCFSNIYSQHSLQEYEERLLQIRNADAKLDSIFEWVYQAEESGDPIIGFPLIAKAEEYLPSVKDSLQYANYCKRKGGLFPLIDRMDSATFYYERGLTCFHNQHNYSEDYSIYCRLGRIKIDDEQWGEGLYYYSNALKSEPPKGTLPGFLPLLGICNAQAQLGNFDSAEMALLQAKELLDDALKENTALAGSEIEFLNAFGILQLKRKDYEEAMQIFSEAIAMADSNYLPLLYNNIGNIYLDEQDYKTAIRYFYNSQSFNLIENGLRHNYKLANNFYESFKALGKSDSAIKYLEMEVAFQDSLRKKSDAALQGFFDTKLMIRIVEVGQLEMRLRVMLLASLSLTLFLLLVISFRSYLYARYKRRVALEEAENQRLADAQRIVDLMQEMDIRTLESKIEGVNEERERLAIELHDGLGSTLASIKLYFSQLEGAAPEKVALFDKANLMLDDACQSLRDYAHNLAGNKEVAGGLALVVQNLAATVSGAGSMKVQVFAHDIPLNLPPEFSRSLYKIVQELLSNAIRHSNAKHMTIQFTRHAGYLNLLVEDDGVGFSPQILSDGMGLGNVRQRVTALGGDITIDSMPGRGSTFLIDIPIEEYDTH